MNTEEEKIVFKKTDINWDHKYHEVSDHVMCIIEKYRSDDDRFKWISVRNVLNNPNKYYKKSKSKFTEENEKTVISFTNEIYNYIDTVVDKLDIKIINVHGDLDTFYNSKEYKDAKFFIHTYIDNLDIYRNVTDRFNTVYI